jgi:hypothetical protein
MITVSVRRMTAMFWKSGIALAAVNRAPRQKPEPMEE